MKAKNPGEHTDPGFTPAPETISQSTPEVLSIPELPAKIEQRNYAVEMKEAGEMNDIIGQRIEILLGIPLHEALTKLAAKPEVLAAYRAAHESMDDELELLKLEQKKLKSHADRWVKHTVATVILRQMRENDCAEIIARGLSSDDDSLSPYENVRLAATEVGYARARFANQRKLRLQVDLEPVNDFSLIKKILNGTDITYLLPEPATGDKYDCLVPQIFLRNDFWTMLAHIAGPNYLPEAMAAMPEAGGHARSTAGIISEAKLVTDWFKLPLREDEGKFYSGKIDKKQNALRQQEILVVWNMAKYIKENSITPLKIAELARRNATLRDLHAANVNYQAAETALASVSGPLSRAWQLFNGSASKLRETFLADAERKAAVRDQALLELITQERLLADKAHGFGLSLAETQHNRNGVPTSYEPTRLKHKLDNDFTLKFWSDLASEEFDKIADEDDGAQEARTQLAVLKNKKK